jgi:transposase
MKRAQYTPEFKVEAVKQVVDKGHSVVDVAKRLGIAEGLLYTWVRKSAQSEQPLAGELQVLQDEVLKLKAELRRTTEERDILKKAAVSSTSRRNMFGLSSMCRVLRVHRSG